MIVDTFLFHDELELLNLRLQVLDPVVDQFIAVQGTHTTQGDAKFCYPEGDFAKLKIVTADLSGCTSPAHREQAQRNWVAHYIDANTLVLHGDLDEIPNPDLVGQEGYYKQLMCYFYMNVQADYPWHGTIAARGQFWLENGFNSTRVQLHAGLYHRPVLDNGGWHFSSLGGPERVKHKLQSYLHSEFNTTEYIDQIAERINNLEDVFGRGEKYHKVPIDDTYPKYLTDNIDFYKEFIL